MVRRDIMQICREKIFIACTKELQYEIHETEYLEEYISEIEGHLHTLALLGENIDDYVTVIIDILTTRLTDVINDSEKENVSTIKQDELNDKYLEIDELIRRIKNEYQ